MTWPTIMAETPRVVDPLKADTDAPDDAPYRFPLNMTQRDRRLLMKKASEDHTSPTQWLLLRIRGEETKKGSIAKAIEGVVSFVLDRRRQVLAEQTAIQLGFHTTEELAEDLLRQAIQDPKKADDFLFGDLRARLRQDAADDKQPPSQPKTRMA